MSSDAVLDDAQLEEKKKILMRLNLVFLQSAVTPTYSLFFNILFSLLVGDKAAFEQQAAVTMEKNKEVIEHLKQQNSELRKRVIQVQRVCLILFSFTTFVFSHFYSIEGKSVSSF